MRRAVEKLSWLVFSLTLCSVVAFAALARLCDAASGRRPSVPLLVNLEPRNARDLATEATRAVAGGGPEGERGARELVRLGGAALPHVLGSLDALGPAARGRVSLALVPIARRMGIAEADHLESAEQALVFWTRFWQDRSTDFRGTAVRRKVARLAERALSLRQKEVLELDTFAVPELVDALGNVESDEDVQRVSRLVPALRHATGAGADVPPNASVAEAALVVTQWRHWSLENSLDFTTLDGPGRLAAVVTETRYFRWLSTLLAAKRHKDDFVLSRAEAVAGRAGRSLALAMLCLFAGLGAGALLATRSAGHRARERWVRRGGLAVACVPFAFVALRFSPAGPVGALVPLAIVVAWLCAWDTLSEPLSGRTWDVLVRSGIHAGELLGALVSALLAAEALTGTEGLGMLVRGAVHSGDLDTLMLVTLWIAAAGLIASTVSAAAAVYRPITEHSAPPVWPSRRRIALALAPVAVLAALAALGPFLGLGPAAGALRTLLFTAFVATAVAAAVTFVLGFLAGMVSHSADVLLARAHEVSSALPTALVAGTLLTLGGVIGPILFGVLRGIDAAFVFRTRLAEGRRSFDLEPISLGRTPIVPQLARLLPDAVRQPLARLFLTPSWLVSLAIAALALGVTPPPRLEPLAAATGPAGSFVALSLGAVSAALFLLIGRRRTGGDTPGAPVVIELTRRISEPR